MYKTLASCSGSPYIDVAFLKQSSVIVLISAIKSKYLLSNFKYELK